MTPTTVTVTQTSATTVTQTYVVETTTAWVVIGVLVALLAVVAGLALRRR
jgi:MYXO-CTERM domain-containing protein